ncbi:MAG: esterase family protein [Oscillospiraceae bacterium]|nr:esterase family protein [Oscillospiraceae bacterium]
MALIRVNYYSSVLGMQRVMDVILPQPPAGTPQKKYPVLYLLHGGMGDHTSWTRRSSIERYAMEKNIAVVMPSNDLGYYADMKYGFDFFRHTADELPRIVHEFFPAISDRREDTFAAGLSMGGFGAFKLGILRPEKYAAVASLSGSLDLMWAYDGESTPITSVFRNIYGGKEDVAESENDLPLQMEKLIASGKEMPKFYMACGTEDFLYETNVRFRDRFAGRADLTYFEEPGTHEWGFWDRNIQRVLDWLPLSEKEGN